jgi:hypothetical protein
LGAGGVRAVVRAQRRKGAALAADQHRCEAATPKSPAASHRLRRAPSTRARPGTAQEHAASPRNKAMQPRQ